MKYKVTYEYRGRVTVEVEALNKEQAVKIGQEEADEAILHNLGVDNVTVRHDNKE